MKKVYLTVPFSQGDGIFVNEGEIVMEATKDVKSFKERALKYACFSLKTVKI